MDSESCRFCCGVQGVCPASFRILHPGTNKALSKRCKNAVPSSTGFCRPVYAGDARGIPAEVKNRMGIFLKYVDKKFRLQTGLQDHQRHDEPRVTWNPIPDKEGLGLKKESENDQECRRRRI